MHHIWIKHYNCSSEKTEVPVSGGDSSDITTSDATNPLLAETDQMLADESPPLPGTSVLSELQW